MKKCIYALLGAACFGVNPQFAIADETETKAENQTHNEVVIVYGRARKRIGEAISATEGFVSGDELRLRPILRPGEILEAVPGMIATQHSGGGKANQFYIRGFNLDHGTDFALRIDEFPVNFLTHGHGQGYLDANGLIPETIDQIEFRKGPLRADIGDFSLTGAAKVRTLDKTDNYLSAEIGAFNYYRALGALNFDTSEMNFANWLQYKHQDGPWAKAESFDSIVLFSKAIKEIGDNRFELSFNLYHGDWNPTDQIPTRAVGTLLKDEYDSLDNTLTGESRREVLNFEWSDRKSQLNLWAQHYDWDLYSNFTYFLDDPINSDQIRQYENLNSFGGRFVSEIFKDKTNQVNYGFETRFDDIKDIGLDHGINGKPDYYIARFAVQEKSLSAFIESKSRVLDKINLYLGLRADKYWFETKGKSGVGWSSKIEDSILSPKIGINYEFTRNFAVFANYAEGFHSNDARGVTRPIDGATGLVKGKVSEFGIRYEKRNLILSLDYWQSRIDSELVYVADAGQTEPSDASKRHGYEFNFFYRPTQSIVLDGNYSTNSGKYVGVPFGLDGIPGAIKASGEVGASFVNDHWQLGARLRYLGQRNLIEDYSVKAKPFTLVNLRASYQLHNNWLVSVDLLNALNTKGHDIDYYYTTRLPGEADEGVDDIIFKPVEPRQLRLGVRIGF